MLSFTIGASSISIFIDGIFYSVDDSHVNHPYLLSELRKPPAERDLDAIRGTVTIKRLIERLTLGRVTVTDTEVMFEQSKIGSYLAERMIEIMNDGIDIEPYAAFLDNVMNNPAVYVHDELYQWMEKGRLPITPDGHFLAFKKVRADFTDCHTGRFDNSPGTILEMDRTLCDTNRHNHCSTGFHFASTGYLNSFGGQRVVVVKINPRDVTSIPSDYKFTKGRCCRYEVVAELTCQSAAYDDCWKKGVIAIEDPAEFPANVLASVVLPSPVVDAPIVACGDPTDAEEAAAALEAEVSDAGKVNEAKSVLPEVHREGDRLICSTVVESKRLTVTEKLALPNKAVEGVRTSEVRDVLQPVEEVITFRTSDNREFTSADVKKALVDTSIRAAARALGIQDSTLRGWLKRIK